MSVAARPAAGLYAAAWALCVPGLAALLIGRFGGSGALFVGGLALLLAGLVAAAGYQLIARGQRSADLFRGPSPPILFGIHFAAVYSVLFVLFAVGFPSPTTQVGFLLSAIALFAGYALVVWLLVVRSGALSWREIVRVDQLSTGRVAFDLAIGAATMFGAAFIAGILGTLLANLLGTTAPDVVPVPKTSGDILMVALGASVLVPIGEELFFRGYSMSAWLRDLGERSALIRMTVFFALIHILNITSATFGDGAKQAILEVSVIAPVGFALGWLYLRRGLVASIAGHAAFNLFGVLVIVLAQYLPTPGTGG